MGAGSAAKGLAWLGAGMLIGYYCAGAGYARGALNRESSGSG